MWSRATLKTSAKGVLRKHYWFVFAACLVAGILSGGSQSPLNLYNTMDSGYRSSGFSPNAAMQLILFGIVCTLTLAVAVYKIFVGNLIQVGYC
ncbi:MAG: hypothetical protein FWE69_06440, partial [Clostridiales bacterium]|nr:hypothetical protein [Clostridiales bacterium]